MTLGMVWEFRDENLHETPNLEQAGPPHERISLDPLLSRPEESQAARSSGSPATSRPACTCMLVARSPRFDIYYGEIKVGDAQPDLIVEGAMMVQVKVGQAIGEADRAEAIHNLKAADLEDGLLVDFGRAEVEVQRIKHAPRGKPTRR